MGKKLETLKTMVIRKISLTLVVYRGNFDYKKAISRRFVLIDFLGACFPLSFHFKKRKWKAWHLSRAEWVFSGFQQQPSNVYLLFKAPYIFDEAKLSTSLRFRALAFWFI